MQVLIGSVAIAMVHQDLLHRKYFPLKWLLYFPSVKLWEKTHYPESLDILVKYSFLFLCFEAGLVGLVVFRDVFLVGGAVYLRGSSLGWKVRTTWFSNFPLCLRNCVLCSSLMESWFMFSLFQWKRWGDFFNLDGNGRQKVEPLLISKVSIFGCLGLLYSA